MAAGQIPPAAVPGLIAANAALEGHASVRGDDQAWGYNLGIMFDFGTATRIGLSYRSSIEYEVEGSARFTTPTVTQPTGAAIVAAASDGPLATGPASVDLELPDSAILSLRQAFGSDFHLLADVSWTGWSSVEELRVVRDTGAAVPDSTRTPRLPDVDRKWVAVGARWHNDMLAIDVGYAHLFSGDVPLNQDGGNVNANGLIAGQQESAIDIVSAQITVQF